MVRLTFRRLTWFMRLDHTVTGFDWFWFAERDMTDLTHNEAMLSIGALHYPKG